jgi:hypothetical protein
MFFLLLVDFCHAIFARLLLLVRVFGTFVLLTDEASQGHIDVI